MYSTLMSAMALAGAVARGLTGANIGIIIHLRPLPLPIFCNPVAVLYIIITTNSVPAYRSVKAKDTKTVAGTITSVKVKR